MKYTKSVDGKSRATIYLAFRFSKEEFEEAKKVFGAKTIEEVKSYLKLGANDYLEHFIDMHGGKE